jgi:hypothetical protein
MRPLNLTGGICPALASADVMAITKWSISGSGNGPEWVWGLPGYPWRAGQMSFRRIKKRFQLCFVQNLQVIRVAFAEREHRPRGGWMRHPL